MVIKNIRVDLCLKLYPAGAAQRQLRVRVGQHEAALGEAVQCGELQEALTVSRENIAGTETHHRYRTLHKEPKLKETYLDAAKFY